MQGTTTVPPTPPKTETVSVKTNGDVKTVGFKRGMTVADAVADAGLKPGWRTKYYVNQKEARSSEVLKPGDIVTVAPRVRNG